MMNQKGQRVLIAAHGNSLRALVKYLDNMSDADIMALNIPTGTKIFLYTPIVPLYMLSEFISLLLH